MSLLLVGCLLLAVPSCLAQSANASASATQTLEPCGQVSSYLTSYASASPSATQIPIDVQLAQACYDSVPLYQDDATDLIDGLSAMLQFQSDLEFLANPPSGYLLAGVDLLGELSDLRDQVTSGNVTGEMDFETQVATIIARAHDGHLGYSLDGLAIFGLIRQTGALVSVSLDGTEIPKVYAYSDVLNYANGTGPAPLAISQVNGLAVSDYILYEGENTTLGGLQDPDAQYNSFFWQWNDGQSTQNSPGLWTGFLQSLLEPWTNVTLENGTTLNIPNIVTTQADFTDVTDGESFYQKFLNVRTPSSNGSASASASASASVSASASATTALPTEAASSTAAPSTPASTATSIIGYPTPTVISSDGALSGYFLEDPGFEDTAVLVLRSMSEDDPASFQSSMTQFLDLCRQNNKQQLVIDVSGNGGGNVALGYDTFKQLFPSLEPYGVGNYRAHEGFRLLGEAITNSSIVAEQDDPSNYTEFVDVGGVSDFDAVSALDINDVHFTDFASYYGPLTAPGGYGNYTNLTRVDINNTNFDLNSLGIVVSGYGNMTDDLGPQPFDSDNIILLSDGQCSSTCTIFAHFLKYQAKVKSVAIGGRPTTGPMQAIGGIKGSQVEYFQILYQAIVGAAMSLDNATLDTWTGTSLETLIDLGSYLMARTPSGGKTPNEMSFNFRNNIYEGDTSLTPLQFVYEASDCRLYYKPENFLDITTAWTRAASQAFGLNGTEVFGGCVAGSTNQPSSLSGDAALDDNGMIQNGSDVNSGPGILNQTTGGGNGTSGPTPPTPYTGIAGRQQISFSAVAGAVLFAAALLV